jgi:hypothetical protein
MFPPIERPAECKEPSDYSKYMGEMLLMSTKHLTLEDSNNIHSMPSTVAEDAFGWFMTVHDGLEESDCHECGMSGTFSDIIKLAQRLGVRCIRFDADELEIPDLPTFDW